MRPTRTSFHDPRGRLAMEQLEDRTTPATLLSGFAETVVAAGLSNATAMELAPNGDVWVLEQAGAVKRFRPGNTTADLVANLSGLGLSSVGERGVLGIAFDPNYASNKFVYLYYTSTDAPNPHNRVGRFTVNDFNAADYAFVDTVENPALLDEVEILNLDPLSSATNHNGGAIHFGPDGKLYVAVGDNANSANAQSLANRHGKILRINADGTIPADNPTSIAGIGGATTGANRAIWAAGLRNPYTFTFDPDTGVMHINDVGEGTWEEVNVGGAGRNFGWPGTEGDFNQALFPNFTRPLYAYSHGNGTFQGRAITGGAFYNPATNQFPAEYAGDYFFADFVNDWINVVNRDGTNPRRFATGAMGAVDLRVAPDGSLYYLARITNEVFRVTYTGGDATFHKLMTTEHVDLAFDHVGGQWEASSEFGAGIDYRPDQTLHYVHPGALVNRPSGTQWDFIGVAAGQPIYLLPQTQNQNLLFLGAASEETAAGTFASYTETDPRVTNTVALPWVTARITSVRGPGHFSVWQTDQFGQPIVWVASANGLGTSDKLINLEGGHAHYNWAFTAPGFYQIDFQASAVLTSTGQTSQSSVASFYFTVDNALKVTSVTPTETGFVARFNRPIDVATLNLYDATGGTLGLPDVTLVGANTGPVRGSLVVPTTAIPNASTGVPEWTDALNAVEFVRTGGPLPPDTYALTLRGESAAYASNTAFKTSASPVNTGVLDGNFDGTPGDSFTDTYTVAPSPARVVGVPDFTRGFGQAVNVPANGSGIPITIDDAVGVTRVTFDLLYDPTLLTITAATRGGNVPDTFTVTLDMLVEGRTRVTFDGPTALPGGALTLVNLTASVPATAEYADKHVLRLANVQINSGATPARADHAIHVAAFVGDSTGNRAYSGLDAALTARLLAGQGTGFVAYQNADPVLVADVTANGTLSSLDATLLAQKAVGLPIPLIPDLPASGSPAAGGPDPRLFIPTNLSGPAGSTVTVPVRIEVTETGGASLQAADYAISFDPIRFTLSNPRVTDTLLAAFTIVANIDNTNGVIRITTYSANGATLANGTLGDVLRLDFTVKADAPAGASPINLRNSSGTTATALNEGQLTLSPAPTDGASDANVDGSFTVDSSLGVSEFRVNGGTAQRSRVTSLRVAFSSAVPGLTAANFPLVGFAGTITVTPNASNTQYTLTFSGAGTERSSLRDGLYTLNVLGVTGLTGTTTFQFHRLFGDSDGDRDVDARNLTAFRQAFGNTTNLQAFDWDNDGDVDRADYLRFLRRLGRRI